MSRLVETANRLQKYQCAPYNNRSVCFRYLAFVCLVVSLTFFVSCASSPKIVREQSASKKPGWINKQPTGTNTLYFVGISSNAETLEEAQTAALKDAMGEISGYMGNRIESVFQSHITETERDLESNIRSESVSLVFGAKIEDSYYEKVTRVDNNLERYDYYVLVSFSKAEAKKELERQEKEKEEKASLAYKCFQDGQGYERNGQIFEARKSYQDGLSIVSELNEMVEIKNSEFANTENLKLNLQMSSEKMDEVLHRYSLTVKIKGESSDDSSFRGTFVSTMANHEYKVADTDSTIEMVVDLSVSYSSMLMNNYVYYAEGNVVARRVSDKQTIGAYSFKSKGFHKSSAQAIKSALAEAGKDAGEGITKVLIEDSLKAKSENK